MILYRPVGLHELALIYDSGMTAFPARLPQQPIFYPVLQLEYARQTASGWNAQNGELAGYVTQFKVEDEYINQFEEHTVGGSQYQELWIPTEEVEEFNRHLIGHIKVVEAYFGAAFQGFVPDKFGLQGKKAVEQFTELANTFIYKRMDFYLEIKRNHKAVFLNYPFWQAHSFKNPGLKDKTLQAIKEAWLTSFPRTPLPLPPPVQETIPPEEQSGARTSVQPVHEKNPPVRQVSSRPPVHLSSEEILPLEQTDSESLEEPVQQTPLRPRVRSFREETSPAEEPDSDAEGPMDEASLEEETSDEPAPAQPRANPVHEDTSLLEQTSSHFAHGVRLGLSGLYPEAIEGLFRAVQEDPEDVAAQVSLGVAFQRSGQHDRALACYETALKIDPIYAEAHYFRANILYSQGNIREAIAGYTIAMGLQPALIEAHEKPVPQDRLTEYTGSPAEIHKIARPARRILDLNRLLESHPGQADLLKERAAQYHRLRNYAQAIADYSSFLAIQADDADALHARGVAYEQLGQHDRAVEDFQRAVALNPQFANDYINRGVAFGNAGNYRQAVATLTDAIRLAPKNPDGYFNRGIAYFQQGDLERAIEDFSNVIQLSPGDGEAYYWCGIANEEAGRQREAIASYRQFLVLSQDARARAEVEQKLRRWNEEKQRRANSESIIVASRQRAAPVPPERPDQEHDLHGLIVALGKRALESVWVGRDVKCYGEKAEALYAFTSQDKPIEGRELLAIAAGIRQTVEGDFHAFDPGANAPWIFIRAWEGTGFYIETNDPRSTERLKSRLPSVEDVEGATPPYEGLFVRL